MYSSNNLKPTLFSIHEALNIEILTVLKFLQLNRAGCIIFLSVVRAFDLCVRWLTLVMTSNTAVSSRFMTVLVYNQSFFDRQLVCFDR